MKKITLLFTLLTISIGYAQAPLEKHSLQLNAGIGFSDWGTPVYLGVDYGIATNWTIGGELSYQSYKHYSGFENDLKSSIIGVQANGNYHFNNVFDISNDWDLYAGANINYYSWSTTLNGETYNYNSEDNFGIGLQIGGRYFFNDKFALNVQFGGGNVVSGGRLGITYKL